MRTARLAAWLLLLAPLGLAQQTVFNVPSADVLKRGKVYFELDVTAAPVSGDVAATPRMVFGLGRNFEAGFNLGAFSTASGTVANFVPTIKWKVHEWTKQGVSLLVGDNMFVPLESTSYRAGNYVYVQLSKQWKLTRATGGVYHFTRGVVAGGSRAGGQFSLEQTLTPKVALATDWYTGNNAVGYVTPGLIWKLSPKVTLYPSYQIGNRGVGAGNHQFLFEVGWNLN